MNKYGCRACRFTIVSSCRAPKCAAEWSSCPFGTVSESDWLATKTPRHITTTLKASTPVLESRHYINILNFALPFFECVLPLMLNRRPELGVMLRRCYCENMLKPSRVRVGTLENSGNFVYWRM